MAESKLGDDFAVNGIGLEEGKATSRREQLKDMLAKSLDGRVMEERAKLGRTMEEKLVKAYATSPEMVESFRQRVRTEIKDLFRKCNRTKVLERDLRDLEDRVRVIASEERQKVNAYLTNAERSGYEGKEDGSSNSVRVRSFNGIPQDDFQVLMEADRLEYLMEQQEARNKLVLKQKMTKEVLDKQLDDLNARRERERKEAEEYGNQLLRDSQQYRDDCIRERNRFIEKNQRDKEAREVQLRAHKERLRKKELRQKRDDAAHLERIKRELEKEKREARRKVEERREYMNKVRQENEEQRKIQAALRQKEWEEDLKRNEEYAEKLAREERNRIKNLEEMKSRASKNQEMYLVATKARDDKIREDEEKANRYLEEKAREEDRKAKEKEAKRRQDNRVRDQILREQIAHKEKEEEARKRAFHEAAIVAKAEAEKQRQIDLGREKLRKEKALKLRESLDRQMKEKNARKYADDLPTKMSFHEQTLNAARLREIANDETIVQLVKQNLKPRPHEVLAQAKAEKEKNVRIRLNYF